MSRVLILSNEAEDAHVHGLVAELDKLGHPWALIDPGDFPQSLPFSAWLNDHTKESSLMLKDGTRLFLEEMSSVWYRRPTPIAPAEHLSPLEKTFIEREANAGLWGWLRGLQAFWVNHPDAIRAAGHKPHQLQLAQSLGLYVRYNLCLLTLRTNVQIIRGVEKGSRTRGGSDGQHPMGILSTCGPERTWAHLAHDPGEHAACSQHHRCLWSRSQ